jgi:hypothetical protein
MTAKICLIIAIFVEILLFYNFCTRIVSLSETQKRIDTARLNRDAVVSKYRERKNELDYVRTDSYVEDIARRKLRYGREGDHLYIVPAEREIKVELEKVDYTNLDGSERTSNQFLNWYKLFFE